MTVASLFDVQLHSTYAPLGALIQAQLKLRHDDRMISGARKYAKGSGERAFECLFHLA